MDPGWWRMQDRMSQIKGRGCHFWYGICGRVLIIQAKETTTPVVFRKGGTEEPSNWTGRLKECWVKLRLWGGGWEEDSKRLRIRRNFRLGLQIEIVAQKAHSLGFHVTHPWMNRYKRPSPSLHAQQKHDYWYNGQKQTAFLIMCFIKWIWYFTSVLGEAQRGRTEAQQAPGYALISGI